MNYKYFPIIKTGQSELRALNNTNFVNTAPIIELTRGRLKPGNGALSYEEKLQKTGVYSFNSMVKNIEEILKSSRYFVDITKDDKLMCKELDDLLVYEKGYSNWVKFLEENFGNSIVPVMQISNKELTEKQYTDSILKQFDSLAQCYKNVAYRAFVLEDGGFDIDLYLLNDSIQKLLSNGGNFYLILDYEYITQKTYLLHADKIQEIIGNILSTFPKIKIIISSTSYPNNVTTLGEDLEGYFNLEEFLLSSEISKKNKGYNIYHSDYASINPIRNDVVKMAKGWVPKIETVDVETCQMHYYRKRTKDYDNNYKLTYHALAKEVIETDVFKKLPDCWGKTMIENTAKSINTIEGSSPSFWISVRMNLHINYILSTKLKP